MVKAREPVTVDDVIDHFDLVKTLAGIEHVGVGSDIGIARRWSIWIILNECTI